MSQHLSGKASRLALLLSTMLLAATVQAANWQEGTTYTAGNSVDYNGKTYTALVTHTAFAGANWNPAATPTLWKETGSSATASPTPQTTLCPVASPLPQPTEQLKPPARWELITTNGANNCPVQRWQPTCPTGSPFVDGECKVPLPVVTPTATPHITSSPASNNWNSSAVYTAGQRVSYNGSIYEAKWWTQGEAPSSSDWGPWKLVSMPVVTATPAVTPTPTPKVTPIGSCISPGFTPECTPTPAPTATPYVTVAPSPTPCPTVVGNGGCSTSGLPKHALIGYWHNFTNPSGDTYRIRDVAPEWDVIMISFADDAGNGAVAFNLDKNGGTEAEFIADVAAKRAQGKKVILSLGGQEGRMTLSSKENVTNFVNSLHAIITKYGFDGIDLDLESGAGVVLGTPIINNLIDAVKQLKAKVGPSFYLSMAPEHPYVQGGYVAYSGIWGAYLPIIDALRDDLNMIHVQYYNNGGLWTPYSNGALNEGTVDGLVGGSLMLIEGFKTVGGTGWEFKGLRADQVAFGVPSGRSSANTGFVSNQVVTDALTCLTQLKNCGMVKPKQAYPDYRGVMTWSINWDKKDGYNFSKPTSATLKALPK
ncbi:chitinase [Chitinibacter sp. GC72]|uniref:chitinase n=1 Tax=Chitinibacter sp. GC72 TaxID=1526917 RepID=UPI0012FC51F5|nr:carbohydrate-binding protein [Chitinibacter sp. GC72]